MTDCLPNKAHQTPKMVKFKASGPQLRVDKASVQSTAQELTCCTAVAVATVCLVVDIAIFPQYFPLVIFTFVIIL